MGKAEVVQSATVYGENGAGLWHFRVEENSDSPGGAIDIAYIETDEQGEPPKEFARITLDDDVAEAIAEWILHRRDRRKETKDD